MSTESTIITIGELIHVLSSYNLTSKVFISTGGSYQDGIQLTREDIQYKDDTEDIVVIVIE